MLERLCNRVTFDDWRGDLTGRPVFWSRTLWEARGWRISLHRLVDTDDVDCFHSHPATALRIVLAGGYVEQLADGAKVEWKPGQVGLVRPELTHRISALLNGRVSYSLWIRGPKTAGIQLVGAGWPARREAADA